MRVDLDTGAAMPLSLAAKDVVGIETVLTAWNQLGAGAARLIVGKNGSRWCI